ncbi:MAG TPA: GMC family oxidoreductase [Gemmataceae bacterium]|jgi:choline dehydrogenase-like flavoprotein
MPYDFDFLVAGSGAGGGTFAYACAKAGKSVLLVERGGKPELGRQVHDEQAALIGKKPYDDRPVWVDGEARRLYMGGVVGGGTSLYGAALIRPSREDFHPGQYYGTRIPRAIWDWPIDYETLEPYYTRAEVLYGVAGFGEEDFGPLQKPRRGFPSKPILPKPINQCLIKANRARGLKPFCLPLAIDFNRCLQCPACPGYLCPNGARRSSAQLVEKAIGDNLPLHVLTGVEVEGFSRDTRGQIIGVRLLDRSSGKRIEYRARRYALAAGAIASPTLLLRSGIRGEWIGRNYMMHLSPIVAGLFRNRTGADETYVKQVGFWDYYFGTREYPHKMGLVQSLPAPGPLMMRKAAGLRLPPSVIEFLRRRMLPLTGIIEDLPKPANRVTLAHNGLAELHHNFDRFDLERGRWLSRLMRRILRNAGAMFCLVKSFPSGEHVAHQCGTLRFGKKPDHAVADPECRLFDHPNVFIVDGSFFPSSLGVGPALTIMANALRVADVVTREI